MKYYIIAILFWIILLSIQSCKVSKSASTQVEPPKKKSAEWYYQQGVIEAKNTNSYVAIDNFNKAIKKKPDYYDAYMSRASTYLTLDSIDSAVRDYDSLLVMKTTSQEGRGKIYFLKGNALYSGVKDSLACSMWRKSRDLNYYPAWDKIRKYCK